MLGLFVAVALYECPRSPGETSHLSPVQGHPLRTRMAVWTKTLVFLAGKEDSDDCGNEDDWGDPDEQPLEGMNRCP